MAPPRKLSDSQEDEAVAMTRKGVGWRVVADVFGISVTTLRTILRRHRALKKQDPTAVDMRRRAPEGSEGAEHHRTNAAKMSEAEWKALCQRRLDGEDEEALEAEAGLGAGSLRAAAGRYGMTFQQHGVTPPGRRRKRGEAAPPAERFNPGEPAVLHPGQRPPEGRWATWLFLGGRGAGKTTAGARWLHDRAMAREGARLALIGATLGDVREVMVEGPAGLRNLPGAVRPRWEAGRGRLVWPNGSEAHAFSADAPERLRGPQFEAAWADEFCAWGGDAAGTLAVLRMGLRLGADPRLVVTTTPKPVPALKALMAEASCARTHAPTGANAANLSPAFLETLEGLYGGSRLAAQELDGLVLEDAEGALWRRAELGRCRGAVPVGRLERVVVAVDPPAGVGGSSGRLAPSPGFAGTSPASGGGAAACGIVVAGRAGGRFYVLADESLSGAPGEWARAVAAAARAWGAHAVTAEANQGGEMVRAVLRAAGVSAPLSLRHAKVGKRQRAEPVATLYEQGKVTHCGAFPLLEEEMCGLGAQGWSGRCDRVDALVWAITALSEEAGGGPRVRFVDW